MVRLTIIGSASIQIRADDKYFEPDVRRAVKKIKNVSIDLKADVDLSKATKKIRDLRYRITSKDAVLKVDADVSKAEEKMAKLLAKFIDKEVNYNVNANTRGASTALQELDDRYSSRRIDYTAVGNTGVARAELAALTRPRTANIRAKIDPDTLAAITGLFNTLTGTLPFDKIKAALTSVAANFEGIATKATVAVTAIGALSASVLTLGADLLSISGDVTQVVGLAALFPVAFGSMAAIVTANKMAWKNFGDAVSKEGKKGAEALAKLPPIAQEAVLALRGTYTEIQKPVQNAFWDVMGTALQDTVRRLIPDLTTGLSKVSASMANVTKSALDAFAKLDDGSLLNMLSNLASGLENLAPGVGSFIDALNTLGEVGSTYLPQFGTYVAQAASNFKDFITEAEKTGQINVWIETGVRRLQELGSITKSTAGFFKGLTDAARISGAPGLAELAEGMRNLRDTVQGEPFQSKLVTFLKGAREGTDALGEGFGTLTEYIGDSAQAIGIFMRTAGEIAGISFESIRALFDGTGLGGGLQSALNGLKVALKDMEPGFADMGSAIGDLGIIAEELFKNMAPGLNALAETIKGVVAGLRDGIVDAMPVFNEFVQALLDVVKGPIIALAEQVGGALTAFSQLPSVIQNVIMSLGLFLLLKAKFGGFFSGIGKSLRTEAANANSSLGQITRGVNTMRDGARLGFRAMGDSLRTAMSTGVSAATKLMSPLVGRAQDISDRTKAAFSTIGAGLKNGLNIGPSLASTRANLSALSTNTRTAAASMATSLKNVGTGLVQGLVPANSALGRFSSNIRETAGRVHADLAPARNAFRSLGPAALTAGQLAGRQLASGLKTAGAGLLTALGGIWGVAIMGAIAVFGLFAAEQAKAKAQIEGIATAFEQSGGRLDAAARKQIATNLNIKDSFLGIKRESALDLAEKVGVPLEQVVEAAANVPGAMGKVQASLRETGNAASETQVKVATVITGLSQTGGAVGGLATVAKFFGIGASEGQKLTDRIKEQQKVVADGIALNLKMGSAIGQTTVQGAALAANFETLSVATSNASEKFSALKSNLDITTGGMQESNNAFRDNAEGLLKLGDNVTSIAGKYGGVIEGTDQLTEAFKSSLIAIDGTFQTSSLGAIEFSREMDSARDNVLKLGSAELDKLLKAGVALPEAQSKALAVMNTGTEDLRRALEATGIDAGTVQQILGNLKLNPDDLKGALVLETADAEGKAIRFQLFMAALAQGNYEVAFTALTDDAKSEILKVTEYAEAYKNGGWNAVIDVINKSGKTVPEFLQSMSEAKNLSDINKVIDIENPGAEKIAAATSEIKGYNSLSVITKSLTATDDITAATTTAKAGLDVIARTTVAPIGIRAIDEVTGPVAAANAGLDTIRLTPDVEKAIRARNETLIPTQEAQGTMGSLTDTYRGLYATNNTAPGKDSAAANMGSLPDVVRNLFATNMTGGPTNSARIIMGSLTDVTRALKADNQTPLGKAAAQLTINTLSGKTVDLNANDRTGGPVQNAKNAIASVVGKTVDIITNFFSRGKSENADGGFYMGGVRQMADGGILKGIAAPAIKAYANGGMENHTAQIARGAMPVRIWAEPETGGEAYIPLSPSKRKRSLEILRRVMAEFGLSQFAQFADGGMVKSNNVTPSIVSQRYAGNAETRYASAASGATAHPTVVNYTVNPSQGLSEEQIGQASMNELYWKLASR